LECITVFDHIVTVGVCRLQDGAECNSIARTNVQHPKHATGTVPCYTPHSAWLMHSAVSRRRKAKYHPCQIPRVWRTTCLAYSEPCCLNTNSRTHNGLARHHDTTCLIRSELCCLNNNTRSHVGTHLHHIGLPRHHDTARLRCQVQLQCQQQPQAHIQPCPAQRHGLRRTFKALLSQQQRRAPY
jgi:hypothetical protein